MKISNASPMQALEINKSIKRLDNIATWFMKRRLFALEDLCQKMIDWYIDHYYAKYCKTCKSKEDWYNMKPSGECRWCWYDRMCLEFKARKDYEAFEQKRIRMSAGIEGWHL